MSQAPPTSLTRSYAAAFASRRRLPPPSPPPFACAPPPPSAFPAAVAFTTSNMQVTAIFSFTTPALTLLSAPPPPYPNVLSFFRKLFQAREHAVRPARVGVRHALPLPPQGSYEGLRTIIPLPASDSIFTTLNPKCSLPETDTSNRCRFATGATAEKRPWWRGGCLCGGRCCCC
jgi:hypothetical protein